MPACGASQARRPGTISSTSQRRSVFAGSRSAWPCVDSPVGETADRVNSISSWYGLMVMSRGRKRSVAIIPGQIWLWPLSVRLTDP